MKSFSRILTTALVITSALSSCQKDKETPLKAQLNVPSTYEFQRNGQTSVDIGGQVTRQNMLKEINDYLFSATTGAMPDKQRLLNMYENLNNPFADPALNASGKKLSDKTSASETHAVNSGVAKQYLIDILSRAADASTKLTPVAAKGNSGIVSNPTTNKTYFVDEKGIEYTQQFQKSVMGSVFMDQLVNGYLSDTKLNVDNEKLEDQKNFTEMEHHWDEAFGYFSKEKDFKLTGDPNPGYWGGYVRGIEDPFKSGSKVYAAFRTGRAAIVAKDYTERDKQRDIIRQEMELVCAVKAVHYLEEFKSELAEGNIAEAFHELSEGLGFIYSLRYAASGKVSASKSNEWMNKLIAGDGFYASDISTTRIPQLRSEILAVYGLDASKTY